MFRKFSTAGRSAPQNTRRNREAERLRRVIRDNIKFFQNARLTITQVRDANRQASSELDMPPALRATAEEVDALADAMRDLFEAVINRLEAGLQRARPAPKPAKADRNPA